jgi:hypothetical protein
MFSTLGGKRGKYIFHSGIVFAKFRRGKNNFKKYIYIPKQLCHQEKS